jgi:hypothetical protein
MQQTKDVLLFLSIQCLDPQNTYLKSLFFASFLISDLIVSRKMDHFDISFVIWKVVTQNPLSWIWCTFQEAQLALLSTTWLNVPALQWLFAWHPFKNGSVTTMQISVRCASSKITSEGLF